MVRLYTAAFTGKEEMIYFCKASDMDALYYGEFDIEYGENIAEFPEEMELIWQS